MALKVEHEIHQRRFGRNLGLGLVLVGFAAIIFGLTIAKISGGGPVEGFDHAVRPSITVEDAD